MLKRTPVKSIDEYLNALPQDIVQPLKNCNKLLKLQHQRQRRLPAIKPVLSIITTGWLVLLHLKTIEFFISWASIDE